MATLQSMIDETRRLLLSGAYQEVNRLSGAILSTDTTINVHYPLGSAQMVGAIIAIDLELIQVWETSGTTITVCDRGVNGSTAAAHSDGARVEIQPKFSQFDVQQAINADIDDLSGRGVFSVQTLDITYNPAIQGYDLAGVTASSVTAIQELRYKQPGPSHYWPKINQWALSRDMAGSEFASTVALFLKDPAFPGLPVHVRYRSRLQHLANLTDDAQTVGLLPPFANDLPPLGAIIKLAGVREIKRNFDEAQPDAKLQEDVPPGSMAKAIGPSAAYREMRIQSVLATLAAQYGFPASGA